VWCRVEVDFPRSQNGGWKMFWHQIDKLIYFRFLMCLNGISKLCMGFPSTMGWLSENFPNLTQKVICCTAKPLSFDDKIIEIWRWKFSVDKGGGEAINMKTMYRYLTKTVNGNQKFPRVEFNVNYGREWVDLVDANFNFAPTKTWAFPGKCSRYTKVLIKTANTHLLPALLIYKRFSVRLAT
jgi:hypothetical protein